MSRSIGSIKAGISAWRDTARRAMHNNDRKGYRDSINRMRKLEREMEALAEAREALAEADETIASICRQLQGGAA